MATKIVIVEFDDYDTTGSFLLLAKDDADAARIIGRVTEAGKGSFRAEVQEPDSEVWVLNYIRSIVGDEEADGA